MNTVTRKVQLVYDCNEKEKVKEFFDTIYRWQRIVRKAANMIATTHYAMENIKDLFFLDDGTKVKLADAEKDENGILTCSKMNTTYQLLSKHFKGEIPMVILSSLNQSVVSTFNKERGQYFTGERSLRNYKRDIPIPLPMQFIRNLNRSEDGTVRFDISDFTMKIVFGKDLSDNKIFFERALAGEYKLCDSSLYFDGNKMFLLAVFQFESDRITLNEDKVCEASLDVDTPVVVKINGKEFTIGTKEEYLHRRLAIQAALRRTQAACRYNKGGKGIHKKIQAIERYEKAEKNYITNRIHNYTRKLIDLCVKYKCGKLILVDQKEKEKEAKADEQYLLRNWTYYGMKEKINYKAAMYNIVVEVV